MCGRYIQSSELAILRDRFGFTSLLAAAPEPRFNIAPSQRAPVVVLDGGERVLASLVWGLLPAWAKEKDRSPRPINARAETLAEKAAFRTPLERRRGIVVADGFYEWRSTPGGKVPFVFRLAPDAPFGIAGLWDVWRKGEGDPLATFAIVTTAANELVGLVHDRMPAILDAEGEALWLSGRRLTASELARCVAPHPAERMESWAVSRLVNDPKRDGPELLAPAR